MEIKETKEQRSAVKIVFEMLYDILACYEKSGCFNYIPGTEDSDSAWSYFEGELDKVRKVPECEFLGKHDSEDYKKLGNIIDETEIFIKSYEVPGVVMRWRKINPQINYFDCAFDLIKELGKETARQLDDEGMLAVSPSSHAINARDAYFAEKAKLNAEGNLQYTEDRIFQNELLRTLAMVFDYDFFSGEDNSRVT